MHNQTPRSFRILIKLKVKAQLGYFSKRSGADNYANVQEAAGKVLQKDVGGVGNRNKQERVYVIESAAGVATFQNGVGSVGVVMGAVGRESLASSVGTSKGHFVSDIKEKESRG